MGCSFSGLHAIYDAVNSSGDVWINESRFRILRPLAETGSASVFLVKELLPDPASGPASISSRAKSKHVDPAHISEEGIYAVKKVLIQSDEQLELVRQETRVSTLFNHPNLLPLLDHAIITVKGAQGGSQNHEAYLLFPVHLDGTLQDTTKAMQAKKETFDTPTILQIFRQLCAGLMHMHNFNPPYAHNDVRPGNVLITNRKGQPPLAILMDFGSTQPAKRQIRSLSEAAELQKWAAEHTSAPYRAPELWDCPSHADIDERTDIWSLGCTLYAILYGESPFEYSLTEPEGSLQSAITKAQIKFPTQSESPYPEALRHFISWMLQPNPAVRPNINDIILHVDKLIPKFSS